MSKPSHVINKIQTLYYSGLNGGNHLVPLLKGMPGVAKSSIVKQFAKENGLEFIDVRASQLDPVDLRGVPAVIDGRTMWAPPIFLPEDGSPTCLFLDEIGQAPPSTQGALLQLLLDRQLGEYELPENCFVVAATNNVTDRAGVHEMISPAKSRVIHIDVDVDTEDWVAWAAANGIDHKVIAFIRFAPGHLMDKKFAQAKAAFACPRTWEFVSRIIKASEANPKFNPDTEFDLIAGAVGEGAAVEFHAFLRMARNLVTVEDVMKDPKKCKVPKEPSEVYAIASAIAASITGQNFERLMEYVSRLAREFQVFVIKDACSRDKSLSSTKPFVKWAVSNADIWK